MIFWISCLIITILVHEAGHLIAGIICNVQVEIFSIGFWKPYLHFKWKNIDWRITPWLIGGYCKFKGEKKKIKNGFLVQPYRKKVIIVLAGVFINFTIACICYLINYRSISVGIHVDWTLLTAFFNQNFKDLNVIFINYQPNIWLVQISFINFICAITNIFPFPALDGSYLILPWFEYIWKENYVRYLNYIVGFGFYFLMSFQVFFILLNWRLYVIN